MNNIVGQPVEGEDFFDRTREVGSLWESLQEGNHVLLLAPRRVGKTSLAIRVGAEAKAHGWKFALIDVQKDREELGLLANLLEGMQTAGIKMPLLTRLAEGVALARRQVKGKVSGWGVALEINGDDKPETADLEKLIDRLFTEFEQSGEYLLMVMDELPVFLSELENDDSSSTRVRAFLNWFRALRLRFGKHVRWLLLGSVGLDSFLEARRLPPTINDLAPANLGAYSNEDALAFLQALGHEKQIELPDPVCQVVLDQIGWPLPFFLQLVFHRIYLSLGRPPRPATTEDAQQACRQLAGPDFYKHFEPWRGRLVECLGPDELKAAHTILKILCGEPEGLTRAALLEAVRAKFPEGGADAVASLLAAVLGQLERDGYLLRTDTGETSRYAFRSFLLRRYWHTREIA